MIKKRFSELDALRGIASLMVVIFHYTFDRGEGTFCLSIGCVAVDLFFIISGFVILLTIEKITNWREFLLNRFSRLYPAYWVCVSITALVMVLAYNYGFLANTDVNLITVYLTNLTMVQAYFNISNIDGSYWTLIVELLFYIYILFFILFNKKHLIEIVGVFFLILSFLNRYFIDDLLANENIFQITNKIPLLIYFPLFYSGILFYNMKFIKKTTLRWLLLIVSYTIQLFIFNRLYNDSSALSFELYLCTLTTIYLLFILFIYNKLSFIVNKITLWLGSISYVLYLIHQFIGVNVIIPFLTNHLKLNIWLAIPMTMVIIMAISYIIMKYIEKPCLVFIRKKYNQKYTIQY